MEDYRREDSHHYAATFVMSLIGAVAGGIATYYAMKPRGDKDSYFDAAMKRLADYMGRKSRPFENRPE